MPGMRRENARSDDSGYMSTSGHTPTIEEWVASKDRFRVVARGLPMIGPRMMKSGDPGLENLYEHHIEGLVPGILSRYNVVSGHPQFDYWYPKYEEANGQHTLIINSAATDTRGWSAAAQEILSLFRSRGTDQVDPGLQVEIRNPKEMYDDRSMVLPDNSHVLNALEQLEDQIILTVQTFMQGTWSSIAYHNRVARQANWDDPGVPTVIVFCHPRATCDFNKAEERLMHVLDSTPVQIHLELLPGQVRLSQDGGAKFLSDITPKPKNGASISIEGKTNEAGTLGGWVVLNLPNKPKVPCALTAYHVVRSSDQATAHHADQHGVRINDPHGHVNVEYPAAYDRIYTMSRLNDRCSQNPGDTTYSSQRQALASLCATPAIGKVILASGHRISNQNNQRSRLDWALVESPRTFTANKPPPASYFHESPFTVPEGYVQNVDSKVRQVGFVKKGDWVAKRGRTTRTTSGEINHMKRVVEWPAGHFTKEVEILSHDGYFARSGDSGSFVTGFHGELLGLLFATDKFASHFDVAFMTPIHMIQQDVKNMTGGGYLSFE